MIMKQIDIQKLMSVIVILMCLTWYALFVNSVPASAITIIICWLVFISNPVKLAGLLGPAACGLRYVVTTVYSDTCSEARPITKWWWTHLADIQPGTLDNTRGRMHLQYQVAGTTGPLVCSLNSPQTGKQNFSSAEG